MKTDALHAAVSIAIFLAAIAALWLWAAWYATGGW